MSLYNSYISTAHSRSLALIFVSEFSFQMPLIYSLRFVKGTMFRIRTLGLV
jgi:hypothetical protein